MKGSLLEVNDRLIKQPELLNMTVGDLVLTDTDINYLAWKLLYMSAILNLFVIRFVISNLSSIFL